MKQPDLKSIADDMLQLREGKQEIIAAKRRNYYFVLIRRILCQLKQLFFG